VPVTVVPVIAAVHSAVRPLVEIVTVVTGLSSRWKRAAESQAQKHNPEQAERGFSRHHFYPTTWMLAAPD
jgi:hypothetical protein